jgi:hypothetical protein
MQNKWRIGTAIASMWYMSQIGIPRPLEPVYMDYTNLVPQGLGSNRTSGYKHVTLQWSTLTGKALNQLKTPVDLVRTTGDEIYLTIQRADGTTYADDWIDVRGLPHEITYQKVGGDAIGAAYRNVVLFVNNLYIVNDPSEVA